MSYYPAPGAPYVPQQPVNPYGGMGTVGLATPLPNTQMQQTQPQRPQPMNGQQPVQQSAQDGGWLLGRPVSSREEFWQYRLTCTEDGRIARICVVGSSTANV